MGNKLGEGGEWQTGNCSTTALMCCMPSRAWTHPIGVVVALGVHNPIDVSLQIGLVNRHEAVLLEAAVAAMTFRVMVIQTSTRVVNVVITAQAACTGLISPFCTAPPMRTFSRAASGHGIASLTKRASIGRA